MAIFSRQAIFEAMARVNAQRSIEQGWDEREGIDAPIQELLIGECFQDPDASEGSESQTDNPNENGQYYVFLPDGKLQKVQYSGKQRGRFVLEFR